MNDLKYIIVNMKGWRKDQARAIIFNGMVTHSTVVPQDFECIGAGFMILGNIDGKLAAKCWGKSVSLDIKSDPIFDAQIIRKTLTRTHPYI